MLVIINNSHLCLPNRRTILRLLKVEEDVKILVSEETKAGVGCVAGLETVQNSPRPTIKVRDKVQTLEHHLIW